jgi:iron only hydrogenase large subunit-like protein
MLEKQSLDEFLANVNKGKTVIVSLSPQSRASLAVHFGISPLQVKLTLFILFLLLSFTCILHMVEDELNL